MKDPSHPSVAVLIEMSSAHGRGLIRGVAEYAQQRTNWSLRLEETGPLKRAPSWLRTWQGDGIIARLENEEITRAVLAKRLPVVNVSGRTSPPGVPQVDTDNRAVCDLAVDYFVRRGYRHFAYCGNPQFEWSGWRQKLFARRLAAERARCEIFHYRDTASGREQLGTWLKALAKPVALLACNDLGGRTVLEVCERAGLAVPHDVAVLGVDNDEILCALCRPQLASVVPDTAGIGSLAAQTLHELMQGKEIKGLQRLVRPLAVCTRKSTDAAAVDDWHVRQALSFIHGQATRDIRVEDVVLHARTSRRFLEGRFRAVLNRPIHAEIFRVRFEAAQRLLQTTDLPLKDVALRSGFKRADYLSVVFRETLGTSPSAYRERFK